MSKAREIHASGENSTSMVLWFALLLIILILPDTGFAASATLNWNPSPDPDLAGYKVYYQANSAAFPFKGTGATEGNSPIDEGGATSATIDGLDPGNSYYFAVTAYNSAGVESVYSNIIVLKELVAPVVSVTSPSSNTSVNGIVTIKASASDNVGVAKVQFFANGSLLAETATSPYAYSWNTSSLANGIYTLSAKAFDAAGNEGDSANVSVTVAGDLVPPATTVTAPANNATVSGNVVFSASATDNVGVTRVEQYVDGSLVLTSNQNPVSYTWNTAAASNGTHVLVAKAYDLSGNVGVSSSVTVTVFNDTSAPVVSIAAPASNSTVAGTVAVTVNASDNVGTRTVEFYLNGALQATSTSAPFGFTWNTAVMANGLYTMSAKAYDAAGNVGTSTGVAVTVFNDTTPPMVSIASPTSNSTAGGTVTVLANASDNVAVTKVEFYLNGLLKATSTSAPFGFAWNSAATANGSYTLSAKAYDAAGNIGSSAGIAVNVFNDTTAPVVNSFSLPVTVNSTTVAVGSCSATDNAGVAGYLITESATAPAATAAGWSAAAPTSFTFAGTGTRTAYAWAKDASGNVSASRSATVVIDMTLPVIKSMSLSRASSTISVKAYATDNVGVSKMQLYVDNSLQLETTNGSLSFVWSATYKGNHTFTVKAYDAAGNARSQSLSIYK